MIRAETERARDAAAGISPYVILMIPLLVEAARRDPQWRARFDRVAVVDCSEATQLRRVMARSGLSAEAVQRIQGAQATRAERLAAADDVIDNEGDRRCAGAAGGRTASNAIFEWPRPTSDAGGDAAAALLRASGESKVVISRGLAHNRADPTGRRTW